MSRAPLVFLDADRVKLKAFSASSRVASSTVKIEIEVADPHELGNLLHSLQEMRTWKPAPQQRRKTLALPAPGDFE